MHYKGLLFAVLVPMAVCGCRSSERSEAIRFNNRIVRINDSLFYKGSIWGSELNTAWAVKDFSHVEALHKDLIQFVSQKTSEVQEMENVAGSEEMKDAELSFLQFEASVVGQSAIFSTFDSLTTEEEFTAAYSRLIRSSEQEKALLARIKEIQKEFVTRNKIPLIER